MRNRFSRLDAPPTSSTCDAPTPNVSASNATHASFARPACGGAATRTLSARPCRPTTAVRPAPGCTWTWSTTVTSPGSPARSSPAPDMTNRSSTMGAYCRAVPFGPVDPQVDLVALEEQVLARWRELDLFDQVKNLRKGGQPWVFYEGPPTANGSPGLHHVWARVFKDLYPRFQTMRGRDVPRKGGWDCHGLPVELEIEKELGFTHKDDIEAYGIAKFNERCRDSVQRYVEDFAAVTQRAAVWIDTKDAYWTLSNDYIESVWWLVRQLWDKGLLDEGHRVVPYCPRCGTALSSHEVALGYHDVTDPSVYVRFPLVDDDADLLVWTTTPWTLISNVATAVGPDITFDATVPPYRGRFVKDADDDIIADLDRRGLLVRRQPYVHSYPHCWRCGTPLIYWAKNAWFVRTTARKGDLLAQNEIINWHPEHIRHGRFGDWLENNVDWAVSRDRYWGTPLPIWRCAEGHDTCVASVARLRELAGRDLGDLDLPRPYVEAVLFPSPAEPSTAPASRLRPVFSPWFDTG